MTIENPRSSYSHFALGRWATVTRYVISDQCKQQLDPPFTSRPAKIVSTFIIGLWCARRSRKRRRGRCSSKHKNLFASSYSFVIKNTTNRLFVTTRSVRLLCFPPCLDQFLVVACHTPCLPQCSHFSMSSRTQRFDTPCSLPQYQPIQIVTIQTLD